MLDVDLNLYNMNTFLKQTLLYDSKPLTNMTTLIDNIDFFLFFFFQPAKVLTWVKQT